MARLWPKGWIGSKQAPAEEGGDAEARRRDPAAGWPWIPRPAAAGAGSVAAPLGTSEMTTSPVVEQLQMAAASTGTKRKRGLGRRPTLESEAAETPAPERSGRPDAAAPEQTPIPSEESMAKSEDPETKPPEGEAPTTAAGESEAEGRETAPVPVGVGPGEEADQTHVDAGQDAGDTQGEAGAEGAVAGLAALAGATTPARGWRRLFRRSVPLDEGADSALDAGEAQAEAGQDAGDAATVDEGEVAAAGVAAMAGAGTAAGGWRRWIGVAPGPDGRRNWLGTKQVAAVVLLLLAAEIGYVVNLNVSSSSNKSASPPPLSTLPPLKTPTAPVPTTVPPPKTAPNASPSTTVAPAKPAAAPVVQAAAAPLGPCTASDVNITTVTGQSSYSVGQAVNILTTVSDVHSCIFQPAPAGTYSCGSSIVVASGGNQVWPAPGQAEPCNAPAGMTMNPGSTESLSATWTASAAGTYQAIGMWGWSAASGQPNNTANVASPAFTVS